MAKKVKLTAGQKNVIELRLSGPVAPQEGFLLAAGLNGVVATHNSLLGMAAVQPDLKINTKTAPPS
jgi:hypothetical protein